MRAKRPAQVLIEDKSKDKSAIRRRQTVHGLLAPNSSSRTFLPK
jgi:hypothetical protein